MERIWIRIHLEAASKCKDSERLVVKCGTLKMATTAYQKLLQAGTKIIAVGRNYAAHAKELGNAVPKVSLCFSVFVSLSLSRLLLSESLYV